MPAGSLDATSQSGRPSPARKSHHAINGQQERVPIYKCYNRIQHKERCDGPTTYRAEKVDAVIEELLLGILARARQVKENDFVKQRVRVASDQYKLQIKKAKAELDKSTKELSKWESLMLDSIENKCVFTPEQVKKQMDNVQSKIEELMKQIQLLQNSADESDAIANRIVTEHQQLLSWADVYAEASLEEKRMVVSQIIKAVTITRNYGIQVDFNISEAQYLSGMEMM